MVGSCKQRVADQDESFECGKPTMHPSGLCRDHYEWNRKQIPNWDKEAKAREEVADELRKKISSFEKPFDYVDFNVAHAEVRNHASMIGSFYRHYKKGTRYEVNALAVDEKSGQVIVCYRDCDRMWLMWARPLEDFNATVEIDGRKVRRFELLKG